MSRLRIRGRLPARWSCPERLFQGPSGMAGLKRAVVVLCLMHGFVGLHAQGYFDCLSLWNGPNRLNTVCVTSDGAAGTWNTDCACIANAESYDCTGVLNGGAFPGTMCQWTNDSVTYRPGIWSPNCTCDNDSTYMVKDCPGVSGGHAWPGTPCVIPGSAQVGVWSPRCICEAAKPDPCSADFRLVQAHRADSLPVPYAIRIWNLSRHGGGPFVYRWDFGDGGYSLEQYPSHTYKDGGPYELCLSIDNGQGCSYKTCRSVSVDNDGMFNGLVAVTDHGVGFTVFAPDLNGVKLEDIRVFDGLMVTSRPGSDQLDVAFMSRSDRAVEVSIVGADGRSISSDRRRLVSGTNNWRIPSGTVRPGIYLLKLTDGPKKIAQRLIRIG